MAFNGVMPAVIPKRSRYGLLSAADVTDHTAADSHWVSGFAYETETCNYDASLMPICDPSQDDISVGVSDQPRGYRVRPFGVKVADECLTPGSSVDERKQRVLRQLDAISQKVIEQELWNGTYTGSLPVLNDENPDILSQPRWLASDEATTLVTGAVSLKLAIALLEKAIGDCGAGSEGVIHAPRDVAVLIGEAEPDDDDMLVFKNTGTRLVSGVGYSGSGPGQTERANPLRPWIYATGPVMVHLGEPELLTPALSDSINVRTNIQKYVAMQPAAVYWDGCCHFGVQVDLTLGGVNLGSATF